MAITEAASSRTLEADICVIGAGSAGLAVAAGAAQMGACTVLVEADRMGGDCLNTGCVPSKSLLAVAKLAHSVRSAARFGVRVSPPEIDFGRIHDHVHDIIATIAPHDSEERFTKLGCTVIRAHARFVGKRVIEADGKRVHARRFVIATGSRAAVPPIPGLDRVPYFTNETLFDNTQLPQHLVIIGGGPIAAEMAQAHRRLGAEVSILARGSLLPKDDPEAVAVLREALTTDGVNLLEFAKILRVQSNGIRVSVLLADRNGERAIDASHLLVATGRAPNIEDLGLDAAGVRFGPKGIEVDTRLRTSNRRVYAAGDVAGSYQFTHLAAYHAGIVLQNALFHLPARIDLAALPWVTYTEPELAQVGLTEEQARQAHGASVRILNAAFAEIDRALTDGAQRGFTKIIVTKRGRVLGATLVGRQAGELLLPWALAISRRIKIAALARVIVPYPSLSEITKRVAGSYYTPTLFGKRTRMLVRLLGRLG